METPFYALLYRLRYTPRWSGTYFTESEDVAQHSFNVAIITHLLCEIKKNVFAQYINTEKATVLALFHDYRDSISTHIISPIKKELKKDINELNEKINEKIIRFLPEKLMNSYNFLNLNNVDQDVLEVVNIADAIDAYCKAKLEVNRGNGDFTSILNSQENKLQKIMEKYDYAKYFGEYFLPSLVSSPNTSYRYIGEGNKL